MGDLMSAHHSFFSGLDGVHALRALPAPLELLGLASLQASHCSPESLDARESLEAHRRGRSGVLASAL